MCNEPLGAPVDPEPCCGHTECPVCAANRLREQEKTQAFKDAFEKPWLDKLTKKGEQK